MLDTQFIGLNVRFAVYLLAALVMLAVFWLIFDAWLEHRTRKEAFKWFGFLLLALGFVAGAATPETATALAGIVGHVSEALRLAGYAAIVIGQFMDPLQPILSRVGDADSLNFHAAPVEPVPEVPVAVKHEAPKPKEAKAKAKHSGALGGFISFTPVMALLLFAGAATVAVLYWRRATTGLERHLKPVAWGFTWLALSELLHIGEVFASSRNPLLGQFTSAYGPLWWVSLLALTIGSVILGRWVWYYLTKRLVSELFMILVAQAVFLFLVATTGFTFMLLKNVRTASLADLSTASNMLQYSIASKQAETMAQAKATAASIPAVNAITARDRTALSAALADTYKQEAFSGLIVTDSTGVVLLRAQDPDRWGDSISSDPLVRRAIIGQTASNVVINSGIVAPNVSLVATSPVRNAAGHIIGTITVGRDISNAFVDNIRSSTGLESTVYGGDVRAATTLTIPGTADRAIGVTESQAGITTTVLKQNKNYSGTVTMQNRTFLAALAPLRDVNNRPVGMLQVAHPTDALYAAANRSLQVTFFAAIALILLAVYPIYRLSRFIERQLK